MNKSCLWTQSGARLQQLRVAKEESYNWLFLPGGPGLGSESLTGLPEILDVPGALWLLDLPGDGSNTTDNNAAAFANWSDALVEAVNSLSNVILVAHSTGGMYALATPALKDILSGLVLMDSAPNANWQTYFSHYIQEHPLPQALEAQKAYNANPSNETLKQLTLACTSYFLSSQGLIKYFGLFASLPYNHQVCDWSAQHFDHIYKAQWVPDNMPALIFAGAQDHLTPLSLFRVTQEFHHENIVLREVDYAAHFPWLDNPAMVKQLFTEFALRL